MPVRAAGRSEPTRCSRRGRTTCPSTAAGVRRGERNGRLARARVPAPLLPVSAGPVRGGRTAGLEAIRPRCSSTGGRRGWRFRAPGPRRGPQGPIPIGRAYEGRKADEAHEAHEAHETYEASEGRA